MTNVMHKADLISDSKFHITVENEVAFVVFHGVVTIIDLVNSFSNLIRHPDFKVNMNACYDLSNALVTLDMKETEIFFHFSDGLREKRGDCYKLAFVYNDEMTKMLVNFYRLFLARTEIELLATDEMAEAKHWFIE